MTLKEKFMNRLLGKGSDEIMCGCTTTYGMVDLMKKCGHERPRADTDPVAMTELALAGHRYAGFEWIKAMGWDITGISEVLGCTLGEPKIDSQYFVKAHPFAESLEGLDYPSDFLKRGRFPLYKQQFQMLREKIGDELAIFGETEGPFTAAANLVGSELFMRWTIKKPDDVFKVLDVTKQAAIEAINFAFDNGADYYVLAEPTSGPALMSPKAWGKYMLPLMKEVVSKSKGPLVLHICGNTDGIIALMCDTGVAGISIEEKADMKKAVEIAQPKGVKVFGNVATATTLFMGKPEECYQEAMTALNNGTDFLTPGCGIAPHSPLENLLQIKRARDDFYCK
ncbi:MAG: MtaA/CmuA family methyltransferase [Deltaproteobacteria bacterium]|nr:MtaA/CmuA family methyltransferase [Deltaproteobacteria bacterium]